MAGPEGDRPHFDRTAQTSRPTEQLKPQLEGGNGAPGLPPTLHERANPPPGSTLSRAVERTQELYERNGWVFLPLGEAGQADASSANTVDTETPEAKVNSKSPITDPPKGRWWKHVQEGSSRTSENKSPITDPPNRRRRGGAL